MSSNISPRTQEHLIIPKKWRPAIVYSLLFVIGLFLSMTLANNYGQAWDDEYDADTGRTALNAYLGYRSYLDTHDQRYYGPSYFMISELVVRVIQRTTTRIHPVDIRHTINFLSFLLSLPAFYHLAQFQFSKSISLLLTSLLATQPLLFGHAFINQKDIPLMTATMWAFYLGVQAFNRVTFESRRRFKSVREPWIDQLTRLRSSWVGLSLFNRVLLASLIILSTLLILDLLLKLTTLSVMTTLIEKMYAGQAWEPLQSLFARVAVDSYKTPLSLYLDRAFRVYLWFRIPLILFILWIDLVIIKKSLKIIQSDTREHWIQSRSVILAGTILGLATTLRAPAIFIGMLVCLYAFYRRGRHAWILLLLYTTSAYIALYLLWPFMWESTLINFLESLQVLSEFPAHPVLYRGEFLTSDNLPWHYLPTLIGIQLTEPVPALAIIGIFSLILRRSQRRQKIFSLLVFAWFAIPYTLIVVLKTPLYGNFRQILFLLPPLFFLCGFPLSEVEARLRGKWYKICLAAALLFPGILGITRLHPYEYTYYNQFVGGPGNLNGLYELDYWCTGYREAARYLNEHAPYAAKIIVAGPEYGVSNFIRSDLQVYPDFVKLDEPFYSVACEHALQRGFYGELRIVHEITRARAVYSVIRAPN